MIEVLQKVFVDNNSEYKTLTKDANDLIIKSGKAVFIIREIRPETLVILAPRNEVGEPVHRNTIEPISNGGFWLTQYVLGDDNA